MVFLTLRTLAFILGCTGFYGALSLQKYYILIHGFLSSGGMLAYLLFQSGVWLVKGDPDDFILLLLAAPFL